MSVGLQVIGDYLHQFKLFAKEVTRSSFRTSEVLVANNVVLGQNIKALNDHLISTTIDLDPSERK
ncbi:hypothetical protein FRC03_002248 [Tulasnella sp. 419]|nr:hypothetical protein FRC03_002248 [Tulasnella sp. 419]